MDFEKNTIIATAAGTAAVIALVTAVATQHSVNRTIKTVNFDQSIDVATAKDNSDTSSTEEEAESAEAGTTEYSDYADDVEQTTGVNRSSFNVIETDGMIRIKDSTIRVPAYSSDADDGTSPDDLYVFLPGENTIEYDSTSNYLELNDTTIVRTIAANDATYEGVCSFKGQDAEDILIGEKKINDDSAIAVIYTVPSASDNDKTVDLNAEAENVQAILDNTTANAEITSGSLFGYSINPDWLENVVVTNEGCEFIGKVVTPREIHLRKSTSLQMKRHLDFVREAYGKGEVPLEYAQSVIQSYLGILKHTNDNGLREKICKDFVLVRHPAPEQ